MRRALLIAAILAAPSAALGQFAPQEWPAPQDGMNNACYDVGYFQANNLIGSGTRFACTDPTGKLVPSATPCVASGSAFYQTWVDGTFTPLPQEPFSAAGSGLSIIDDPGDTSTVISLPAIGSAGSCTNCSLTFDLFGRETARASGTAPVVTVTGTAQRVSVSPTTVNPVVDTIGGFYAGAVSGGNEDLGTTLTNGLVCDTTTAGVAVLRTCTDGTDYADPLATYLVASSSHIPTNGVNIGTIGNGVLEQSTSGGVSTPTTWAVGTARLPFGSGTNGQLTDLDNFKVNGFNPGLTSLQEFQIYNAASTSLGMVGFRVGTSSSFTQNFSFDMIAPGWSSGGGLATGDVLAELNAASTSQVLFSNFAGGPVNFATGSSRTPQLKIIPNGVTIPAVTAPSTPASGFMVIYEDSTSKNLAVKNDAGTVNHGIQTKACGASTWISAQADTGLSTCTQPAFTDVSGSLACGQLPALTGTDGIASTAGTCTVTNSFKGKVLVTGSDTTPDFLGNKVTSPTGTVAISTPSVGTMLGLDVAVGAGIRMLNFDFFGLSAGSGWLVTGNDSTVKTFGGFAVEYPLGGAFTTSRLRCINGLNTGTGYTSMSLTVTRNGSPTSAAVTIPASSATVAFDSGAISVSTGAVTDKYGLELTYNGATVPAGITDFTCSAAFQ